MRRKSGEKMLVRSDQLLLKKYYQYIIPTMINYAAFSVNQFLDSILVSNLLNSDAMAIVNLAMPFMFLLAAIYSMLGIGGATVYAIAIGKRDRETAGKALTASCVTALAVGLVLMLIGILFPVPLAKLLCHDELLLPAFMRYLHVLILAAPFVTMSLTFISFLPAEGYPGFSTAVNVVAAGINILMVYLYIHFLHMGVEGVAWATLTGYLCATIVVIAGMVSRRLKIYISRKLADSFTTLREGIRLGRSDAMNHIGIAIQVAACNRMATSAAGTNGVVAYSLCQQTLSVMVIFIGAVIGTYIPIISILHGQRDYKGEKALLKTALVNQFFIALAGMVLIEIFAPRIGHLYNITEPTQLAMSVYALRVFVLSFIPRYAVYIYYRYLTVIGLSRYSMVLSALDSFAGVVPVAWIMIKIFGIKGLWWAFPVTMVLLLVLTLICNRRYEKLSEGRLVGPLLLEKDVDCEPVLDVTISKDPSQIAGLSHRLQQICEENGLPHKDSVRAALAVEELAIYASNKKRQSSHVDILVRINEGNVEIDFRSLGDVFNPLVEDDSDIMENIRLLRGVASRIENDYLIGMNSTRVIIEGR